MGEENPRVGRRLKSDTERLEARDLGGREGQKKKKEKKISVRRLEKILCE